jgi:sucrose phosphorylase
LESLQNHAQGITGVMLNAYPDSIGGTLSDALELLQFDDFRDVFSLFYVLPTFFNSDLDRGFSIIDYDLNQELVSNQDLDSLKDLAIDLKFDIVLNHLSVASHQFKDLLAHGASSRYKDFFINWNAFWKEQGTLNEEGIVIPNKEHLQKLFMRKAGLPILKLRFPDGTEQPYWNTFYQKVGYEPIQSEDIAHLNLSEEILSQVLQQLDKAVTAQSQPDFKDLNLSEAIQNSLAELLERKKFYLGQMDVNAQSPLVWDFYRETLEKLKNYGCKILRLDAFAYLHKAVGQSNFFNTPGTWEYLERINAMAQEHEIQLLPEIHAEYGSGLHKEVADKGYMIYDFFLPGLLIHAIEFQTNTSLLQWTQEILDEGYRTVNMLGCHDGIPVLDLKGKTIGGNYHEGLLKDETIEQVMEVIMDRGGKVKNLYGPNGEKVSYYQVNATFFSALGEDENKLLLARAIQLFVPGIPQVWYLDLFAGKNDYEAVERAGAGGHKEINRTNLSLNHIKENLHQPIVKKQLELLHFRNTSKAFAGRLTINSSEEYQIDFCWKNGDDVAHLKADLRTSHFHISGYSSETDTTIAFNSIV